MSFRVGGCLSAAASKKEAVVKTDWQAGDSVQICPNQAAATSRGDELAHPRREDGALICDVWILVAWFLLPLISPKV
jgi:hypothetical protein